MTTDLMEKDCVLEMTRTLAAPPDRVFRAFTETDALAQWFRPTPEMTATVLALDVRVGGRFAIVMSGETDHALECVYRVVEPPHRLVFSLYDSLSGKILSSRLDYDPTALKGAG